ncbi:hypothetical protein [Corynebacterium doosanense]|uniref:Uncharacterized protein n=1 Tax=Corynebacterium doosanense CAU 212 = DSM 45436 TaxID=558173 RepID=A0A097IJ82_9CORY|nr:hypothetical protein [Corynebacterium doosanense]AIT62168.1 hypothetical protein CDOO_01830 [Corynebacterium doosanense CAU 212 = DSM 45436]
MKFNRETVAAAFPAGWDTAVITGSDHQLEIIGVTTAAVICKGTIFGIGQQTIHVAYDQISDVRCSAPAPEATNA